MEPYLKLIIFYIVAIPIGTLYAILGAHATILTIRESSNLVTGIKFPATFLQSVILGIFTLPLLNSLVKEFLGTPLSPNLGVWLLDINKASDFETAKYCFVSLLFIVLWWMFFLKIHDKFVLWKCPGAKDRI